MLFLTWYLSKWSSLVREPGVSLLPLTDSCVPLWFCSLFSPFNPLQAGSVLHKALLTVFKTLHPSVCSAYLLIHILPHSVDVTGTFTILASVMFHVPPPSHSAASASFSTPPLFSHTCEGWSDLGPFPFCLSHPLNSSAPLAFNTIYARHCYHTMLQLLPLL